MTAGQHAPRRAREQRLALFLSAAVAGLLAALAYRRALGFAYFNDDPTGHFAWMEGRTLAQFFTSAADYGYYRPVVFAVLRWMETLFGAAPGIHNPVADHALLLVLHGANVSLLWLLAYRLGGRPAYAWVAAAVFAAVPFHYEAVTYVASLTHPLLLFWLLATLLLYESGRRSGRRLSYALALVTMTLGLLTHESGLFILPALVGLEWVLRREGERSLLPRRLWPFFLPPALFAVLWLSIPKNSDAGLRALGEIGRNVVPFLQTLVYPLLPLLSFDLGDVVWLFLVAAATVAAIGYLSFAAGLLRLWAYALGWIALSILPSLLFLSPDYVYGSPRLSYVPSVGVALFWALPVLWLWWWAETRRGQAAGPLGSLTLRIALSAFYAYIIVIPTLPFTRCQLDFYGEASRIVRDMAQTAAFAPPGQEVAFVNVPYFFSSYDDHPDGCPNPYPWTPVGAVVAPPYARLRDFVRFNGGPDRPLLGVRYEGYAPGWRTHGLPLTDVALRAIVDQGAIYVFDLNRDDFFDLSHAWGVGESPATAPMATFGESLDLLGTKLIRSGDALTVALRWGVISPGGEAPPEDPLVIFVHIYDEAGSVVAQHDAPPAGGYISPSFWQPGDLINDAHSLDLSGLPEGAYRLAVGVYRAADGGRLDATMNGQGLVDDVYVLAPLSR